ncbi:MAG: hypothetical protein KAR33_03040 [Candidatus Thorarchaeota archaeon]|nr:hypothetical protein [Candidatus Thorarchaeota archaeon]
MSKILARVRERRFLALAGVLLVLATSLFALVALSIGPVYSIRINGEPWHVTGTKAVMEFDYSGVYFTGTGERSIIYPGLAYDIFLEINLAVVSGSLDFSVESFGEVLFEVSGISEINITLPIEHTQATYVQSPHEYNVTLDGYIIAYCWIPFYSAPVYYFRSIFSGG